MTSRPLRAGRGAGSRPARSFESMNMDVLADIFETIQLRGSFYFRTDFSPPWGTTVPSLGRAARFHYVVQGLCWIRVEDAPPGPSAALPRPGKSPRATAPRR